MASPDVKSTMCVIAMNIFFKFLRCGKGRAKFGSSICVGTAKLSTNRTSSIVWPQSCKQLSLLRVFFVVCLSFLVGCFLGEFFGCGFRFQLVALAVWCRNAGVVGSNFCRALLWAGGCI